MRVAPLFLVCLVALATATVGTAQTYVRVIDPEGSPLIHGLDWREGRLYITDTRINRIAVVDVEAGGLTQVVGLAFDPRGLAFDGTDYRLSTGFDSSDPQILAISENGDQTGSLLAPSELTNGLTFHDGLLWAANAFPDETASIVGLDPATGAVTETIPFPSTQPTGIAFLGDGTLWVSNAGDDPGSNGDFTLYHIERATGTVLSTLGVPNGTTRPRGLAYDGEDTLYVAVREGPLSLLYAIDLTQSGNAELGLSAEAFDLGVVADGDTETQPLSITNTGDADLVISEVSGAFIPENPGSFEITLTPTSIAPGATETFEISFTAARDDIDPRGEAVGQFFLRTNDVRNAEITVEVRAFAAATTAQVYAPQTSFDFGEVRIDPASFALTTREVRIQNVGAVPLDLSPVVSSDPAFGVYSLASTIAPAETIVAEVFFRPTAIGPQSGTISIQSNDPDAPLLLQLTGSGIDPDLAPGSPIWTHAVLDNPNTAVDDPKVHSLVSAGDLTGDGLPDLVYATRNFLTVALDANGWTQPPVLWSFDTCLTNFNCGAVSGVNQLYETGMVTGIDLNGDSRNDVVIGTEGANDHVYALDGKTGEVIWEFGSDTDPFLGPYYSVSARPGLDATGDGIPDVVSGTGTADPEGPNPFNNRRVYFFDGATGTVLWDVSIGLPNFRTLIYDPGTGLDPLIATTGGDSGIDVLTALHSSDGTSAWTLDPGFPPFLIEPLVTDDGEDLLLAGNSTQIVRFDGLTGTEVWRHPIAGTVVWDLAVLPREGSSPLIAIGSTSAFVDALNAETGDVEWSAFVGDQGFGLAVVPDSDGDGREDVAVVGREGTAYLLSGEDGSTIWTYRFGDGTFEQSGEAAVAVPDIDGNGVPEIAIGTRDGRVLLLFGGGGRVGTPAESGPIASRILTLDAPFPSPTRGPVTLRYRLNEPAEVSVQVLDVLGRAVWSREARHPAGSYAVEVPAEVLAPGSYLVRLGSATEVVARRFVVIR
ncbi:MAG: choice-of-anchor D domain-containing protein [Bacteroidota bacterium]